MDAARWRQIEALHESALAVEPAMRAGFLQDACGGDESLLREVESLLAQEEKAGQFLEVPAARLLSGVTGAVELTPGTAVAHYRVEVKLGEGGMGAVYKARDARLGRNVALKFVKAQFSEYFEREARAIAALNHPHIATLHDVGKHEGTPYLAMEFVEGRPLKGPRPLREVIELGIQIASALAAAHAAGIVHRDLKPANILVTEKRSLKILDFGIAKLTGQAAGGKRGTATLTGIGAGTPGYMSPEQIDGKPADSRSDIFAFGCVLYELASGRHPFEGSSINQVLAATATQEPKPLSGAPAELEKLIHRCLRKDPEHRLQHIGDARIVLEELKEELDSRKPGVPAMGRKRPGRKLWAAAGAAALLLVAMLAWRWREPSRPSDVRPVVLTSYPGMERQPSFSPDGSQVAFSWNGAQEDNQDIYVQVIGSAQPLRLTSDSAADVWPAWSPDGKQIAFLRNLGPNRFGAYLVGPLGGPERRLAEVTPTPSSWEATWAATQLAWHPDGRHLAVQDDLGLFLLSIETGEKRRLTTPPKLRSHASPAFSPDGRHLAFCQRSSYAGQLWVLSLDESLVPRGEPVPVTADMDNIDTPVWTADGHEIVFSAGAWHTPSLWRVTASGPGKPRLASVGEGGTQPALTRDGRRLAYSRPVVDFNIWRIELSADQSSPPRRTRLIASSGFEFEAEFSPDETRIAFYSNRSGAPEIWVCNRDGSSPFQITSSGGPLTGTPRWSPDGQQIVFDSRPEGHADLFVVGTSGGKPRRVTTSPAEDMMPCWSRDGKGIYFYSDRTGRFEVWKMPAAGSSAQEEAIQLTRNGGMAPYESPDGQVVYYFREFALWQVPVEGGEENKVLQSVRSIGSFAVATKGIYFIPSGEAVVQFFDFNTRALRTVAKLERPMGDIGVSRDGRTILYSQADNVGSDLMLVENFR